MEIKPLKIGSLTAKIPIIQGGMGIGISLGRLAGTVAKEGGVGVISAAQIGYREADFDKNPKAANLRAVKQEYEKARGISPEGIIGFNIMVAMRDYEDYVCAAIEAGADLIISGAGLPMDLPRIAAGTDVKLAPIVSTEKSARVILKYWDRKYQRMPDLLIIEGPEAGGHLGFTKEQLDMFLAENPTENPAGSGSQCPDGISVGTGYAYRKEVQAILALVRNYEEQYGCRIATALAGGIRDRETVEKAFSLEVDAIQVATRFVTTEECDADVRYKEAYLKAKPEDIMIVKSPVGMPGRAIRNAFMERVMAGEKIPHTPCHGCLAKCKPAEIPYCITDALIHAAKGETEDALLFCGAYAYQAKHLETVKEVIDSFLPKRI